MHEVISRSVWYFTINVSIYRSIVIELSINSIIDLLSMDKATTHAYLKFQCILHSKIKTASGFHRICKLTAFNEMCRIFCAKIPH